MITLIVYFLTLTQSKTHIIFNKFVKKQRILKILKNQIRFFSVNADRVQYPRFFFSPETQIGH